jgi:hypothetical protein
VEEGVEDSEVVAVSLSLFRYDKGCRSFRRPFLLFVSRRQESLMSIWISVHIVSLWRGPCHPLS